MKNMGNISATIVMFAILSLIWLNYYETGCWVVGAGGGNASPQIRNDLFFCGRTGFTIGILITVISIYTARIWLKSKK
jgi:hypothetical protein